MPDTDDELLRLRRFRDRIQAILAQTALAAEDKLQAIEAASDVEWLHPPEPDEDEEAEEARDRERLS
jgi:hypothetical protein